MDYWNLERFKKAQEYSYQYALEEIRNGRKESHWMWYIFPQMRGLGQTELAYCYGISCLEEAKAYLNDEILGSRLVEISEALLELEDKNAERIFGWPDVLKLRSSMTLFSKASGTIDSVFQKVLDAYYGGNEDEKTIEMLKKM